MTVSLRDRLYGDTGLPVQGATVQAYTITGGGTDAGTASTLAASTTTDVNGVWKFTALADPGAGNWYDVKIINGQQVRWRYGNIQASLQQVLLSSAATFTGLLTASGGLTATGAVDLTGATSVKGVPQHNLLVNPGFEIWQRGTSGLGAGYTADRWDAIVGTGASFNGSIGLDATNVSNDSSAAWSCTNYTGGSSPSVLDQGVEANGTGFKGKPVTFSMDVRTNVANHIRLQLVDVDGTTVLGVSAYHSGGNTYERLSVTGTPTAAGSKLTCRVAFTVTATVNLLDNATLVVGSDTTYVPLTAAEDWARCYRYYWRSASAANLATLFATGQVANTTQAIFMLPGLAAFGGAPNLSVSSPSHFAVNGVACTALTGYSESGQSWSVVGTVSGGLTTFQAANLTANGTASAWIAWEWNP